jgi:hypothetical protein
MSVTAFYDDGQVTIYCADVRSVDLVKAAACVVTSPPYNVGLDYDGQADWMLWGEYRSLADDTARLIARALVPGGRAWVNTAVSVPELPEAPRASGGCYSATCGRRRWRLTGWSWSTRWRGPRSVAPVRRGVHGSPRRRRTCGATTRSSRSPAGTAGHVGYPRVLRAGGTQSVVGRLVLDRMAAHPRPP